MPDRDPVRRIDFLSVEELIALGDRNTVLDPHSVLIARTAELGDGNIFYPGVVFRCDPGSEIVVGSGNQFFPGTFVLAAAGGRVELGSDGTYGPGGVQIKANVAGTLLRLGDGVRLANGPEIVGRTTIGDGGQVIGPIQAQSVVLAGGGGHSEPDPDRRASVLKGVGLARGIELRVGDVVNGLGDFALAPVERQSSYHPRA